MNKITAPVEESASLIFISQDKVQQVILNSNFEFNSSETLLQIKNVKTIALEIWHRSRNFCIISVNQTGDSEFKCHQLDRATEFTIYNSPNPYFNLSCKENVYA